MEKSFYNDVEEETLGDWPLYLQRLYINSTLQLGPFPYDVVGFWSLHLFPLYYDNYRLHCRARCYELKSSKGEKIYKICIQPTPYQKLFNIQIFTSGRHWNCTRSER